LKRTAAREKRLMPRVILYGRWYDPVRAVCREHRAAARRCNAQSKSEIHVAVNIHHVLAPHAGMRALPWSILAAKDGNNEPAIRALPPNNESCASKNHSSTKGYTV
jgi:hypothetical protein